MADRELFHVETINRLNRLSNVEDSQCQQRVSPSLQLTHLRVLQGTDVVCPITAHQRRVAQKSQGYDDEFLLLRRAPSEDHDVRQQLPKQVVLILLQIRQTL